jgi:hypothetical protein
MMPIIQLRVEKGNDNQIEGLGVSIFGGRGKKARNRAFFWQPSHLFVAKA